MFGAVASPALKIGITFAILSFVGKVPDSIKVLKMIAKVRLGFVVNLLEDGLDMNTNHRIC